ncbi:MAG: hypothetical protein LBF40_08095 [Deltaproteobacteria bacterium]|jgi:XTP/dITP diphosphohydrolase|nr:hypothetical protein [Deltaproteobacteria bacterium]
MNQYLDNLLFNRHSKKSLQSVRFKKHSRCVPLMLPDFRKTVVLATHNYGRSAALSSALGLVSKGEISFIGLYDFPKLGTYNVYSPDEDGETLYQNAYIKARHYSWLLGKPCLAESHGLVVKALHGEPGPHSKYYGYPHVLGFVDRVDKVLEEMEGVVDRRCAYCLSICLAHPEKHEVLHWQGHILGEVSDRRIGRGPVYQSIFYIRELGKTLAMLTGAEKTLYSFWENCVGPMRADYPLIRRFLGMEDEEAPVPGP